MSALARKYSLQGSWKGSSQSSSSVSCQSSSPRMLLSSRALVDSLGCRGSVGGHSGACQRIRSFGDGPVWQLAAGDLRACSAGAGRDG